MSPTMISAGAALARCPSSLRAGILSAVGNTPLVRLARIFPDAGFSVYGKLEMLNPGGSIKDRTAVGMVLDAFEKGRFGPGATIVESSSGNLAIGLAQICRYLGLRFISVVDTRITQTNLAILRTYGAEVEMVDRPDTVDGDYLTARINRVKSLVQSIGNCFWVNQYANLANPAAHHQTMAEIERAADGPVDFLFVSTSTCGTLRGCAEYIREHGLSTKVIAVDAAGSVIFGQPAGKRLIPGHGASRMPELYQKGIEAAHVHVGDRECVSGCLHLLETEAILAGGSSGAVVAAMYRFRHQIPPGATCVAVLCDRGERYLDTIYSEEWRQQHFGDVPRLVD